MYRLPEKKKEDVSPLMVKVRSDLLRQVKKKKGDYKLRQIVEAGLEAFLEATDKASK